MDSLSMLRTRRRDKRSSQAVSAEKLCASRGKTGPHEWFRPRFSAREVKTKADTLPRRRRPRLTPALADQSCPLVRNAG